MDDRLRRLARQADVSEDDPARRGQLLRERLRAGQLRPEPLQLLAKLGHEAACEALGSPVPEPLELEPWLELLAAADPPLRARAAAAQVWEAPLDAQDPFDGPDDGVIAALDALDECLRAPEETGPREQLAEAVRLAMEQAWGWHTLSTLEGIDAARALLVEPWEARAHLGRLAEALGRRMRLATLQTAVREDLSALIVDGRDPVEARGARLGRRAGMVPGLVRALALAPDGERLLVALRRDRNGGTRLLNLTSPGAGPAQSSPPFTELPHPDAREVWAAAALPGPELGWITADDSGALSVWDPAGGLVQRLPHVVPGEARFLELLPGGERALVGGGEGGLALVNLFTRRQVWQAEGHPRAVNGLTVAPDGAGAVSGDSEGNLLRWDLASGAITARARAGAGVSGLAWPAPERLIVAGDGLLEVWDPVALERQRALPVEGSIYDLAVSPDGTRLAAVGAHARRGWVRLWDLERGALSSEGISLPVPLALTWLPDGSAFLSGARNGAIRRWKGR